MADGLSGTYNSACVAKEMAENSKRIEVINSGTLCGPQKYLVDLAVKLVELGKNKDEIVNEINKAKEEKGYKLSPVVGLYESPLYVYSYKIKSIDDLKAGDKFALPDDPTNGSRALKYLQDELNLIKLKDGVDNPGVKDIVENPKKIEFIEANARFVDNLDI